MMINTKSYMKSQREGYRNLPFFIQAEIICDFSSQFLKSYIDPRSWVNNKIKTAVLDKQNIAEGWL